MPRSLLDEFRDHFHMYQNHFYDLGFIGRSRYFDAFSRVKVEFISRRRGGSR
jgi:hypothetical protein